MTLIMYAVDVQKRDGLGLRPLDERRVEPAALEHGAAAVDVDADAPQPLGDGLGRRLGAPAGERRRRRAVGVARRGHAYGGGRVLNCAGHGRRVAPSHES